MPFAVSSSASARTRYSRSLDWTSRSFYALSSCHAARAVSARTRSRSAPPLLDRANTSNSQRPGLGRNAGLVGVALYFLWQLVPLQLQAKKSEDFDTSSHGGSMSPEDLTMTLSRTEAAAAPSPAAEALGYKVGDRVAYSILQTYSEYSAVPAAKLLPVPDNVGMDLEAAAERVVRGDSEEEERAALVGEAGTGVQSTA